MPDNQWIKLFKKLNPPPKKRIFVTANGQNCNKKEYILSDFP
jgi:hypothetical protein